MTTSFLNDYQYLMNELSKLRKASGGNLSVELESLYVEQLDDLWWRLSEKEQQAYEEELANSTIISQG
jgi:hypothetical protein